MKNLHPTDRQQIKQYETTQMSRDYANTPTIFFSIESINWESQFGTKHSENFFLIQMDWHILRIVSENIIQITIEVYKTSIKIKLSYQQNLMKDFSHEKLLLAFSKQNRNYLFLFISKLFYCHHLLLDSGK